MAVSVNGLEVEESKEMMENLTSLIKKLKYWEAQYIDSMAGEDGKSAELAKGQKAAAIQDIFTV